MRNAIATAAFLAALIAPLAGYGVDPAARHQVDPARNRVWVLNHDGVFLVELSKPGRIALSLPDWLRVGEAHGCLPDLALGPKGEAIITSNVVPTLWRIDAETLLVSVHRPVLDADTDRDIGFSGLVYSRQHGAFFATSYHHGSLWRIDAALAKAQKVPLSMPLPQACGVAVRARTIQQVGRLPGLCVRTARDAWLVDFAPDGRAARVGARILLDNPDGGHTSCATS